MKYLLTLALVLPSFLMAAATKPTTVEFKDATGMSLGTAKLSQMRKGVKIELKLSKLSPGSHAIHFHENGTCEGPKFLTAGGHFNPEGKEHGLDNPLGHHLGDMTNFIADKDGIVKATVMNEHATLAPTGPGSLKKEGGVSLVIHAGADDQKTNPSGASGDRIACAVLAL